MSKLGWVVTAIIGIWLAALLVAIGVYIGDRNAVGPAAPNGRTVFTSDFARNRAIVTEDDLNRFVGADVQDVFNVLAAPDQMGGDPNAPLGPFTGTCIWRRAGPDTKTASVDVVHGIVRAARIR